jgi:hypothetical protein
MESIYEIFITVVLPAVSALIAGIIVKVILKYEKKLKLHIDYETQQLIKDAAEQAVLYVGELSAKKLKEGVKLDSETKLDRAVSFLDDFINKNVDIKRLNRVTTEKYIESALLLVKGEGATGERVKR